MFAAIVNFIWGSTVKKCITVAVGTAAVTGGGFWLWFRKEIVVARHIAKANGSTVDTYFTAAMNQKKAEKEAAKTAAPAVAAVVPQQAATGT